MSEQAKSKSERRYARELKTPPVGESKAPGGKRMAAPCETKIGKVIALLERDEGATLDEMMQSTGWLPHTTRAALTGLKKKGHAIERDKRGDASCYRITKSA